MKPLQEYLKLTEETCENFSQRGVEVTPFYRPTEFETLNEESAKIALDKARIFHINSMPLETKTTRSNMVPLNQDLRQNELALDAALSCAFQGFEMDVNVLPKWVDKGDLIDAYTLDYRQIYCNENFFKVNCYTLDQLQSMSIFELYKRPKMIEQDLREACFQALQTR
ncbi:MAG: hypothetical protein H6625_03420 [Bdellovibrionaceae bacterium]|nr:hypothetical protein [Pseudobdellovibrionaceae bacterium]